MESYTFTIIDGTEPYSVIDLNTGGVQWFHDKKLAYRYMAYLQDALGHHTRLEVFEK